MDGNGVEHQHFEEMKSRGKAIRDDVAGLTEELREAAEDLGRKIELRRRLETHPYGTLLVAAGVGYVLGGGLFTPFTMRTLRLAARLMVLPMLRQEVSAIGRAAVEGALGDEGPTGSA